jgi:hypothetical protein
LTSPPPPDPLLLKLFPPAAEILFRLWPSKVFVVIKIVPPLPALKLSDTPTSPPDAYTLDEVKLVVCSASMKIIPPPPPFKEFIGLYPYPPEPVAR